MRSKDGRYWWADDVADGAAAQAEPTDAAVALDRLARTQSHLAPDYPPGMGPEGPATYVGMGAFNRSWAWAYNPKGTPDPTQATSRLEQAIAVLHARRSRQAAPLEPGSYLAIVQRSPEVVLGTPSAHEEAGFHLVHGTW